ncbi:MAG: flagellar motor protein MotD [gamma proteobacterium symbiont of Bathyaustriella thionipta]|nr:flagellar motor protein MotD [gamma proteobacterium symbiont of Bathyaustriella thionipta]MCU7950339.1 flagellar motor protein MotD [gamma proteobacterium symbiont of Bathyaustriella thionipta]MCU7952960.1 flagellar motor protein MotD [gamma proteobacterium symbiont of Bathyaustriella thionipta]MCU7956869.1 flagellar motor protein MotD [gamma proteobacterium symbiont of Bathyaustriella thionipta]MCU7967222.1 flagellar motor protein MotD [gamma proteobacterium symbiont of Bathyaustriella thio
MSRRKKKPEEHVNLERWLVSYADFITLLFAFFVVMYAISSVNEGKYRVLSDTLNDVFQSRPTSATPIEFDNALQDQPSMAEDPDFIDIPVPENDKNLTPPENPELETLSKEISKAVQPLINDDLINIKKTDFWLEIDIKSSILFGSVDAQLSEDAEDVLASIALLIKDYPNDVQVEGFTDNVPIKTKFFPSNWELSSSRAASVVHLFEEEGVDPKRMQAIGYGEHRPRAENTTEAGRNTNRRVNLVILGQGDQRQMMQRRNQSLKQPSKASQQQIEIDEPSQNFNPIFDIQ